MRMKKSEANGMSDHHKCQQGGTAIYEDAACGLPAKWVDYRGRFLCGIHRRVVDRFAIRNEKPLCVKIGERNE